MTVSPTSGWLDSAALLARELARPCAQTVAPCSALRCSPSRDGALKLTSTRPSMACICSRCGLIAASDVQRERIFIAHANLDFDRPAAHLAILDVMGGTGRRVHAGLERFAAIGAGDFHEFQHGCVLLHVLTTCRARKQ